MSIPGVIEASAPAKLNLFLYVLDRRPDGYHNLQTLFQILDWGDDLRFTATSTERIRVYGTPDIRAEDNLAYQAARLLSSVSGRALGVDIHITKRIPMGAGLGGGSSNAATTLVALNTLFELGLSLEQLSDLALRLGSDVPLFVRGVNAYAEGRGELLRALRLPTLYYLLVLPPVALATSDIFRELALTTKGAKQRIARFSEGACVELDFASWRNDLEPVAVKLCPLLRRCQAELARHSTDALAPARMSGSGSALFSVFASLAAASAAQASCAAALSDLGCKSLVVSGQQC